MLPDPKDGRFQELGAGGFRFSCHPGVACFGECCRKLNLVLTPYDVLRLKTRLGLGAEEFIDRHAEVETGQNGWPMPRLQMADNAERTCPFLGQNGCTVYEDRPGACRTYPLGRATRGGQAGGPLEESWFLVREPHCRGFEDGPDWTTEAWTKDQGLEAYHAVNDLFLPIISRQPPAARPEQIHKKMQMFFMACYNLERFREFVANSSLTRMVDLPQARLEAMAQNDLQLLKFAFEWLRFALFGDQTLRLKEGVGPRPA
ncbi:YkgJ family cysteine cluster protein [Desulfarculus baarsii]